MRTTITATSVVLGLFFCASAQAGFRVDSPAYRPKVHPGGDATHVGVPDDYKLVANKTVHYVETIGDSRAVGNAGFGNELPLASALNLLLPNNWVAYTNPAIDDSQRVSWERDQSWVDALRNIAVRKNLRFFIDFNKQVLRVEKMPEAPGQILLAAKKADATGGASAGDPDKNGLTRGDAFTKKDKAAHYGPNGPERAFRQTTVTDASGAPSTRVVFNSGGSNESSDSPGDKPQVTTTSAPTSAQIAAHKKKLADEGHVAEFDDKAPWYNSEMPDHTKVRQIKGTQPPGADMSLTEFYAQPVVINVKDESITDVAKKIAPPGWDVDVDLPAKGYASKNIARLTAERPRGQVIAALQRRLNIKFRAYPIQHLVVVTDR